MKDNQQGSLRNQGTKKEYRHHGRDPRHPCFPHGHHAGYRAGCRCDQCRLANSQFKLEYEHRKGAKDPSYLARRRERQSVYKKGYRKTLNGQATYRASNAKRKQRVSAASAQSLIRKIYLHCPPGYEVDHIVPLSRGGSHHPDNLQYLPSAINNRKRNSLDFDCGDAAIDWRSVVEEPSEAIPQGSTPQARWKRTAPAIAGEDMVPSRQ